jgi:hypothetical protein
VHYRFEANKPEPIRNHISKQSFLSYRNPLTVDLVLREETEIYYPSIPTETLEVHLA